VATPSSPINPEILRWARERAGLSVEDVITKLGLKRVGIDTIKSWELGQITPTYSQLERLAYDIYKRPIAIFFFPAPPDEPSPKQSFRTLPEFEIAKMAPRMHYLIRMGRVMQINLAELNDNSNPAPQFILRDLKFNASDSVEVMVEKTRNRIGVKIETQISWQDTDEAFKEWRAALENIGIYVFKDAFRVNEFSGFCLYDNVFPIIYVNNSLPDSRQIFTLFHELSHLLFGTGGIDTRIDDYIRYLHGEARSIEIKCNKFASEFLVPADDFKRQIANIAPTKENVETLAERYHVSREVILRRFLDLRLIGESTYNSRVKGVPYPHKKGSRGDYYKTRKTYLCRRYLETAFGRFYQGKISSEQLADYLGIKTKFIPGMEAALLT